MKKLQDERGDESLQTLKFDERSTVFGDNAKTDEYFASVVGENTNNYV